MDPVWLAYSKLRRRRFDESIDIASHALEKNPYDQAAWFIKTRAISEKDFIDDIEMDDETLGDLILNEESMAAAPRPGTSLKRPLSSQRLGSQQSLRPMSGKNRPLTGFVRPATQSRGSSANTVSSAYTGNRPGTTSRPMTMAGRLVRLGTQSLLSGSDKFINPDTIKVEKYVRRPALARALCDFLLYSEHNPRRALDLASVATRESDFSEWWWKMRLGKCYYQLGMFRDAERQFLSAQRSQECIDTTQSLANVYLKMDQPKRAMEVYQAGSLVFPHDKNMLIGIARIHEALNDMDACTEIYKNVLRMESSCVEAVASLGAHYFYNGQPEVALMFYRRLLQMGVTNAEVWSNMGLCCFFSSQYDLCLPCFERALSLANDENSADVWFNISHIAIGVGDLSLAYQALKIAIAANPNHAEAWNNLGVLELRKKKIENARTSFATSSQLIDYLYEPAFNNGLLEFEAGHYEASSMWANKALELYPDHGDSQDLMDRLKTLFDVL